jgi:hypothetical protein
MSDQKNEKPPAPDYTPLFEQSKRDVIPVAVIKLDDRYPIELPGSHTSAVTAKPRDKVIDSKGARLYTGACYVIDFVPAIRHHRVVHFYSDSRKPEVRMVHESQVRSWEPL